MIQVLEIKFNVDGSIDTDIIDRNIPQFSHKVQRIRMYLPKSAFTGDFNSVQIAFENDDEEEMINGYCEVAGIRNGEGGIDLNDYYVYDFEITKYYTQYAGLLRCQALVGNITDDEFVAIWESYKFNINVVKGVKNQDYGIPDPDVASLLSGQINNIGQSVTTIKSAYIKRINYDSETFTFHFQKQDDNILVVQLPFKYLKLLYDSTTFTQITNNGQNYKIVAENDDNVSTQNQTYNQISREVRNKNNENSTSETLNSSNYKIQIESPNHGEYDVSYRTFIEMLNTALTFSSTNGENTAVLKIDGNTGKITYNGKEIGSQEDIDTLKKDVELNTQNRHNHSNKAVLDQIKNLGGANGIATLDNQGRLEQNVVKAEQDGVGNVINLYYQGKTLSVPVGNYTTVEECLAGLKNEIEVLIGGTITQEDLDTLKEISDAVLKAQGDIKKLQDDINEILTENVPVATRETAGIVKIGNNINVAEDGTISIDLSGYATTNDVNTAKTEAINIASADATAKANNALAEAKSYTDSEVAKINDVLNVVVDCDHQYEITGQTGHEYNLAIPDETTAIVPKIQGNTRRKSLNEVKSVTENKALGSSGNIYDATGYYVSNFIQVISGEYYSFHANTYNFYSQSDGNGFVSQPYYTADNAFHSIQIPSGVNYIAISSHNDNKLMLVKGQYTADTMPAFEPYDNTLVNSKANLISTNKNLIDAIIVNVTAGQTYYLNNNFTLLKGHYSFSISSNENAGQFTLNLVDEDETSHNLTGGISVGGSFGFDLDQTHKNCRLSSYFNTSNTNLKITLAYGETSTTYTPHLEYEVAYPELGGFDYFYPAQRQIVRQTSEIWTWKSGQSIEGGGKYTYGYRLSVKILNDVNTGETEGISNWNYTFDMISGPDNDNPNSICVYNTILYIYVNGATTETEAKAVLDANPPSLVYKLATPTIETYEAPSGYKAWNGGLQQQVVDDTHVPYAIIQKQYAISIAQQTANNASINVNQQSLIDKNIQEIDYLKANLINFQLTYDVSQKILTLSQNNIGISYVNLGTGYNNPENVELSGYLEYSEKIQGSSYTERFQIINKTGNTIKIVDVEGLKLISSSLFIQGSMLETKTSNSISNTNQYTVKVLYTCFGKTYEKQIEIVPINISSIEE